MAHGVYFDNFQILVFCDSLNLPENYPEVSSPNLIQKKYFSGLFGAMSSSSFAFCQVLKFKMPTLSPP